MKRTFSDSIRITTSKSLKAFLVVLFFLTFTESSLKAQSSDYQFGLRGGFGMATLNGYENNGLKIGLTAGIYGKCHVQENMSIIADIDYSMGGQQSEKWISGQNDEKVKVYSKYSLHYINIPILYQYYFTDILGLEAGANFRLCAGANLKTKIGHDSWKSSNLDYNVFDCGLILGVYTDNLIPNDNFFVSLRAYFGFLDVVKHVGSNKNVSVQISVGYTLF